MNEWEKIILEKELSAALAMIQAQKESGAEILDLAKLFACIDYILSLVAQRTGVDQSKVELQYLSALSFSLIVKNNEPEISFFLERLKFWTEKPQTRHLQ